MTERAKKQWQDWTSDILWVVLYVISAAVLWRVAREIS
jgi:hypothetical protein